MIKKYLSILVCSLISLTTIQSHAQQYLILQNTAGNLVTLGEYVDVQGSPFYKTDWLKGTITVASGKSYVDVDLKYDQLKDQVYVKGPNGAPMLLNDKVIEFKFSDPGIAGVSNSFKSGFTGIPGTTANAYFEVLANGKIQLLKKSSKIIQENKEYNSASSTKTFMETAKYYLLVDNKATLIKKDKKSIGSALPDKQVELDNYIKENNLNLKEDADLSKLITYANTR